MQKADGKKHLVGNTIIRRDEKMETNVQKSEFSGGKHEEIHKPIVNNITCYSQYK